MERVLGKIIFSREGFLLNRLHTHTHTHTHTIRDSFAVWKEYLYFTYSLLKLPSPHVEMLHNINIDHVYDQFILPLFSDLLPSLSLPPSLHFFFPFRASKSANKHLKSCSTHSKSSFCYELARHTMPAPLSHLLVKPASPRSHPHSGSLLN